MLDINYSHIVFPGNYWDFYHCSATYNGNIVGYVKLTLHKETEDDEEGFVISDLIVNEEFRNYNIGNELLNYSKNLVINNGSNEVFLFVKESSWMYWWYISKGFDYYSKYENGNVWLIKEI